MKKTYPWTREEIDSIDNGCDDNFVGLIAVPASRKKHMREHLEIHHQSTFPVLRMKARQKVAQVVVYVIQNCLFLSFILFAKLPSFLFYSIFFF